MVESDLGFLLFVQDGVISRGQALRYLSEAAVRHRLVSGRWQVAHRGVYLTHSGPMTVQQRLWVAGLAVGGDRPAWVAGLSALTVLGMRGLDVRKIHVLVGARHQRRRPPPGVVVHRTRHLPVEDRHRLGRPPCTMPARSVVDAAQWARSDQDAVAVVAAAFQQRLVAAVDMAPVLARMTHVKRRRVIVAAVADAAGGAESVAWMIRHKPGEVVTQLDAALRAAGWHR